MLSFMAAHPFLNIALPSLASKLLSRVPEQTEARTFLLGHRFAPACRSPVLGRLWKQRHTSLSGKFARTSMGVLVHLP